MISQHTVTQVDHVQRFGHPKQLNLREHLTLTCVTDKDDVLVGDLLQWHVMGPNQLGYRVTNLFDPGDVLCGGDGEKERRARKIERGYSK